MPFIVCGLAACFYLYEFTLQVSGGVITHEIMKDLQMTSTGLGFVMAFFYVAYTPMMIPAGLLYDRFGPRILLTINVFICSIGAYIFANAHSPTTAAIGRAFMGFSGAFSFIGPLVLITRWFEAKYFALMVGIVSFMSCVGSMFGEKPLALLVSEYGWRSTIERISYAGVVISILIWIVVRDYPKDNIPHHVLEAEKAKAKDAKPKTSEWTRLHAVIKKPQTWAIGTYSFLIWAPISCFGVLWGVPYLKALYGTDAIGAGGMMMALWAGIGLSSPVAGYVSNHFNRRCLPLFVLAGIGLFSMVVILYGPMMTPSMMTFMLFVMGVSAGGQSLAFGVVNDNTERELLGTAIGFNNMSVVLGGLLLQPLAGLLLNLQWDGTIVGGVNFYSADMYKHALFMLPICYLLCMIITMSWLKETYCRHTYEPMPDSEDNTEHRVLAEA